jgi:hypothetical protein
LDGLLDGLETAEQRKAAIASSAKPRIIIVDFTGNCGKHKLITCADILGGNYSDAAVDRAHKILDKLEEPKNVQAVLAQAEDELKQEERVAKEKEQQRIDDHKRKDVKAKAEFVSRVISPFDMYDLRPAVTRGWHEGKQLSEKQKAVLVRDKIYDPEMPYAQQKQLLDEEFRRMNMGLCTARQITLLKKHGQDARNWTKQQATQVIDKIAANGWHWSDSFTPTVSSKPIEVPRDIGPLASPGQVAVLVRDCKISPERARTMSQKQAGAIIGKVKAEQKRKQEALPF